MKKIKKFFAIFGVIIVLAGVLVVPMSANAYDAEDPLYSNSLIGTTWKINTASIPAGLYEVGIIGVAYGISNGHITSDYEFEQISLGYDGHTETANSITIYDSFVTTVYNSGDVYLHFLSDCLYRPYQDTLINYLVTYGELVYQINNQFVSFQTKIEHDFSIDNEKNFSVKCYYNDLNTTRTETLYNTWYINGTTATVNSIVMPPSYDVENEYYYYLIKVSYTGYIPSIAFYNYDGAFVGRTELDGQTDEVYIDAGDIAVFEGYSSDNTTATTRTIRFIIRDYYDAEILLNVYDDGYDDGYDEGEIDGYNRGFDVAASQDFGKNLLGETLLAPVRALQQIVLYNTSSGFPVTLWFVFSTCVGVALLIWFLKMFAGG